MKYKIILYSKYKMAKSYSYPSQFRYQGPRDETFKMFIDNILKDYGDISEKNRSDILDKEGLSYYYLSFTAPSFNPKENYEFLETLGDSTLNKAIMWYLARRFPAINCPDGIDILTRLKIKFIQKKSFASLSEKLGFLPFISTDFNRTISSREASFPGGKESQRDSSTTVSEEMTSTLEDVFEAFFGATELIIDKKYNIGMGYKICYKIVSRLLDKINISINYEDIVDAKTRLKELFDHNKHKGIGIFDYVRLDQDQCKFRKICKAAVRHIQDKGNPSFPPGKLVSRDSFIGIGEAHKYEDAEQLAATQALENLKTKGFVKNIPEEYIKYCT
jgi:dsRNA-specific ribonuclease